MHSFNRDLDRRLAPLGLSAEVRREIDGQRVKLAGAELSFRTDGQFQLAVQQAIDASFVFAFRRVMLTALCLALGSALVALTLIENR